GITLSYRYDVSAGGTIVLFQAGLFVLAYLFAPREGLVTAPLLKRRRRSRHPLPTLPDAAPADAGTSTPRS
ncbi:MAG: hypothetical protein ACTH8X_10835, partial [Corynebacterium variabile]